MRANECRASGKSTAVHSAMLLEVAVVGVVQTERRHAHNRAAAATGSDARRAAAALRRHHLPRAFHLLPLPTCHRGRWGAHAAACCAAAAPAAAASSECGQKA